MKNVILILSLTLTACGGGSSGGNSDNGRPIDLPPTCKGLYDVWNSTTDLERHDFTNLSGGNLSSDYSYRAGDGQTCSYIANPNHSIEAQIQTAAQLGIFNAPYEWRLRMEYSLEIGGSCATYRVNNTSPNHNAYLVMTGCNELQICEVSTMNDCKTFN
jgi:hypothetical protein